MGYSRNVCVTVQSKNFRSVRQRQVIYVIDINIQISSDGNFIILVEFESGTEKYVTEPDVCEGCQETFVVVIGDSSAVLNLAQHVADGGPGDTL